MAVSVEMVLAHTLPEALHELAVEAMASWIAKAGTDTQTVVFAPDQVAAAAGHVEVEGTRAAVMDIGKAVDIVLVHAIVLVALQKAVVTTVEEAEAEAEAEEKARRKKIRQAWEVRRGEEAGLVP